MKSFTVLCVLFAYFQFSIAEDEKSPQANHHHNHDKEPHHYDRVRVDNDEKPHHLDNVKNDNDVEPHHHDHVKNDNDEKPHHHNHVQNDNDEKPKHLLDCPKVTSCERIRIRNRACEVGSVRRQCLLTERCCQIESSQNGEGCCTRVLRSNLRNIISAPVKNFRDSILVSTCNKTKKFITSVFKILLQLPLINFSNNKMKLVLFLLFIVVAAQFVASEDDVVDDEDGTVHLHHGREKDSHEDETDKDYHYHDHVDDNHFGKKLNATKTSTTTTTKRKVEIKISTINLK
uniref:WAP domain-containing protein n=1 Tax=Strigamia maritima TaxID=126957 RepID=T1JDP0_STRMM